MEKKFINTLEISNYKSIKNLKIDCKRINLFIGMPNTGKSNILEAISLLDVNKNLKDFINIENNSFLFYDQDLKNTIDIKTDISYCILKYLKKEKKYFHFIDWIYKDLDKMNIYSADTISKIDGYFQSSWNLYPNVRKINDDGEYTLWKSFENGNILQPLVQEYVFSYKFTKGINFSTDNFDEFLLPPNGSNLFTIFSKSEEIKNDIVSYLNKFKLELVYESFANKIMVQKKINGYVYQTPFSMLADTLQRIIFYSAAIESHENSIILFEEPEVNSFPPFIEDLANKILESDNQYFITTHSPYLFTTLIESGFENVQLNIVGYKDFQTFVKQVNEDEIRELLNFGTDIFLNLDRYQQ